jgi:ArsR family transcriptional regulator
VLQLPQSTVSRHLKVLSDQNWLRSRRQGTNHLYRMILDELDAPARKLWLLAREQTENWATFQQDQLRLTRLLREKETDSQAFFAGAAAEWDRLRSELYGTRFTQSALLALLPPDYVVADLGCGTGTVVAELAPYVNRVIGVDDSPAMLKAAKRRTAEYANVELQRAGLESLPLAERSCDATLMLLALSYVADPSAALREMARVLKPGGRAIVVDLLPHDRDDFRRQLGQQCLGFDAEAMKQMLEAAGFASPACRPLAPEPEAKGPALFLATATKHA